jgi:hypothetical protein
MATDTAPGGEYQPPTGGGMTTMAAGGGYPVRFDVEHPEQLNRFLPLIKWLLAIPQFLIVYVLLMVVGVIWIIAFFAILFTKKFPQGLFDFTVGVFRWSNNVNSYYLLLRDEYPPFSWDQGIYPVTYEVVYPEELNRWLPLIKWLLVFPHIVALFFLGIVAAIIWFLSIFIILFTAKYPEGLFKFMVGVLRWSNRVNAYYYLMRDEYPPFSLEA